MRRRTRDTHLARTRARSGVQNSRAADWLLCGITGRSHRSSRRGRPAAYAQFSDDMTHALRCAPDIISIDSVCRWVADHGQRVPQRTSAVRRLFYAALTAEVRAYQLLLQQGVRAVDTGRMGWGLIATRPLSAGTDLHVTGHTHRLARGSPDTRSVVLRMSRYARLDGTASLFNSSCRWHANVVPLSRTTHMRECTRAQARTGRAPHPEYWTRWSTSRDVPAGGELCFYYEVGGGTCCVPGCTVYL